jgi:hypothetical protein
LTGFGPNINSPTQRRRRLKAGTASAPDEGSGFAYGFNFVGTGRHRVELYIDSGKAAWNKHAFDWLLERHDSIESALGHSLEWERLDTKQACRIAYYRDGAILDNEFSRTETLEWAITHLLRFKQVFGPIIPLIPARVPKPTTSAPPPM